MGRLAPDEIGAGQAAADGTRVRVVANATQTKRRERASIVIRMNVKLGRDAPMPSRLLLPELQRRSALHELAIAGMTVFPAARSAPLLIVTGNSADAYRGLDMLVRTATRSDRYKFQWSSVIDF